MNRNILYLINPISGTAVKALVKETIEAKTKAANIPYQIIPTVANGDYSFLVEIIREQKITDIVIAGGDGTVNAAINSLKGLNVRFGIIPCGSGNGLALSAGISKNVSKALDIIFEGATGPCDAFYINGAFGCMLCGLGFDAKVAHEFAHAPKRGLTTYIKKTVTNFFTAATYLFTIELKDQKIETDAYFISIANSNQFGNNFTIAPKASLQDGLLDIVIVTAQNKLSMLWNTIRQVSGFNKIQEIEVMNHEASIIYFQADKLKIANPAMAPMHLDGEAIDTAPFFDIQVLKHAFKLIYPAHSIANQPA
ncbi:MAG: diacylglycerol kinase [Chitinophagaceae bacterium]